MVIRQAISCDICGAEKKQTNHWFVAYEQNGELRVSGWNSRNRLRAGSKHLCGQACLHKLADDFMARVIGDKVAVATIDIEEGDIPAAPLPDSSLAQHAESISSARPIVPAASIAPLRPLPLIAPREREPSPAQRMQDDERGDLLSRRAEAWERERERASHANPHTRGITSRKFSRL